MNFQIPYTTPVEPPPFMLEGMDTSQARRQASDSIEDDERFKKRRTSTALLQSARQLPAPTSSKAAELAGLWSMQNQKEEGAGGVLMSGQQDVWNYDDDDLSIELQQMVDNEDS